MKHVRKVSAVPAVADVDIPALIKSSADAVAVLAVGISLGALITNINSQVSGLFDGLNLSSKTS